MILTITSNSAVDRIVFIDEFTPGGYMRGDSVAYSIGGKGLCSAQVLASLGVPTLGITFAAGSAGHLLVDMLNALGPPHDVVWAGGETRTSEVIVERKCQRHSHIISGGVDISAGVRAEFLQRCRTHAQSAAYIIASGSLAYSLPETFYQELIALAHTARRPILVDISGPAAVHALRAQPTILKMNNDEFRLTFGGHGVGLSEIVDEARRIYAGAGIQAMVITCGREGILALTPAGVYIASAPQQAVVNAAGAGDAVSAALAWRLSAGEDWPTALRWGAAVGAATVLTERTAECRMTDVQRILRDVSVTRGGEDQRGNHERA
jgi:1-phosphofructokinase family hexose kinase